MNIKIIKKIAPTVLKADLPCSASVGLGAPSVMMQLVSYDAHDISSVLGRVVLSPAEARQLAKQLERFASEVEAMITCTCNHRAYHPNSDDHYDTCAKKAPQ